MVPVVAVTYLGQILPALREDPAPAGSRTPQSRLGHAASRRFGYSEDGVCGRGDLRFGTVSQGLLSRLLAERFHRPCRGARARSWFWRRHEVHGR